MANPSLTRSPIQSLPAAGVLTAAYTVPAGFETEVPSAQVCNQAGDARFRISVAPKGADDALSQYIYYDVPLVTNDSMKFDVGMILGPGDQIRVFSDTGQVSFTFYRKETSQQGVYQ